MTPTDFAQARRTLGLSASQLGRVLGVDPRTIRRWEADPATTGTARPPHPTACRAVEWLLAGWRPADWPD